LRRGRPESEIRDVVLRESARRRWSIPALAGPLFQAATANLNPYSQTMVEVDSQARGPVLLNLGGTDRTVAEAITKTTFKPYHKSSVMTEIKDVEGRGHCLTIDHGWR
jgi:hypothetical protein